MNLTTLFACAAAVVCVIGAPAGEDRVGIGAPLAAAGEVLQEEGSDRDFHAPWGGPDEGPGSYLGPDHFDAPDQLGIVNADGDNEDWKTFQRGGLPFMS